MSDSTPKLIPLYRRTYLYGYAIVDSDDYDRLKDLSWYMDKNGYVVCKTRNHVGTALMHRIIMGDPDGELVDHVNHVRSDNRKSNLRVCGHAQNSANVRKFRGRHGYRGIWQHTRNGTWRTAVMSEGTLYTASGFKTKEAAARAYDLLARHFQGEFAILNFPDDLPPIPEQFIADVIAGKKAQGNRKLTDEQAKELREARAAGRAVDDLAADYGIERATVYRVLRGAGYAK